jgi:C1A family cysteine protease
MFKVLFALLCITLVAADEKVIFQKFMKFTREYQKVYGSVEEFNSRYQIFKQNLMDLLTEDYDGTHGVTKFSDMTAEEFEKTMLTLQTPNGWCKPGLELTSAKADTSLDWRTKGGVSPVKDQGNCGSCWAFSAVAYLESQALIKKQSNATFSEQQLVDCDHLGDQGCNGGLMQTALQYFQQNGVESDKAYPYTARGGQCKYNKGSVVANVSNIKCYEGVNNATVQGYLTTAGPLSIAVDATSFQTYRGGVLNCRFSRLNHGVLLVGYTQDTWIIKNSWGKNWGEQGFVRVSNVAGSNCGVGAYVVTADLA